MSDKITYQSLTFEDTTLFSGLVHTEVGLLSDSLAMDILTIEVRSITNLKGYFTTGVPLIWYHNDVIRGKFYNPTVTRISKYRYKIVAYSAIILLDGSMHNGGLYSGTTAAVVIADIMGNIAYTLDSALASVQVYGWLPYATRRENLQQILFVLGANIFKDASGSMVFKLLPSDAIDRLDESRVFFGGSTVDDKPVTRVEVTEHLYRVGTTATTLYQEVLDSTSEAFVVFDGPMSSLSLSAGTLISSGVNYANIKGPATSQTVTLTGIPYVHTTKVAAYGTDTTVDKTQTRKFTDATLVSRYNSAKLAYRMYIYLSYSESIQQEVSLRNSHAGGVVDMLHPIDDEFVRGVLTDCDTQMTGNLRSTIKLLSGFTPITDIPAYTRSVIIATNTTWTVPAGVTSIRFVLIGGGSGGYGGSAGSNNTAAQGQASLISNPGGAGGSGGGGGKIFEKELTVTPGAVYSIVIGAGSAGASGGSSGTYPAIPESASGGNTTFGSYSSANGSSDEYGFYDGFTQKTYAAKGNGGYAGGAGGLGGAPNSSNPTTGLSGGAGLSDSQGASIGGSGGVPSNISVSNDYGTAVAHAGGGGGGGGAYNQVIAPIAGSAGISSASSTPVFGIDWTSRTSDVTTTLYSTVYGNGLFVTVGSSGVILTSPDGITWTPRTSGTTAYLQSVTYGNGLFVAAGESGVILTSPDGITWTTRTSNTSSAFGGVTYGNGLFVAVGIGGIIRTSPDGITWTTRTSGTTNSIYAVTYGNGLFVAVGYNILTSPDGIIWTSRVTYLSAQRGAIYGNGLFVVVGPSGVIRTSPDGITWTTRTSGVTTTLYGIAYGNSLFVAVGTGGVILTSPDGITWTPRTSGTTNSIYAVTYGNGLFVTVGSSGVILTSGTLGSTEAGGAKASAQGGAGGLGGKPAIAATAADLYGTGGNGGHGGGGTGGHGGQYVSSTGTSDLGSREAISGQAGSAGSAGRSGCAIIYY